MKNTIKILALGIAVAASATMAKADSLSGELSFSPTSTGSASFTESSNILSVDFTGGVTTNAGGSPTINSFNSLPAALGNFTVNLSTDTLTATNPEFTVTNSTPVTLAFYATSAVYTSLGGDYFDLTLDGYLTDDSGASTTPATLAFSSQQIGAVGVSYSGTITATPEPSSLALLGTGLLGAAGFARRRFLSR